MQTGMTNRNLYQLIPALSDEEYEALKADIAAHGIQVPIEEDEQGNILDGHHRLKAAKELGLPDEAIPRVVRKGLSEEEKLEHILRLNLLRRQLTQEQKLELAVELWRLRWSQRRIARVIGVDHRTVGRWIHDVGQMPHVDAGSGKPVLPATITDTLGRRQPASKPRSVPAARPDSAGGSPDAVAAVPDRSVFERPEWKEYHILEAQEALEKLPEPERPKALQMISEPGVPPKRAVEILHNMAAMPAHERAEIFQLYDSEDPVRKSLAKTKAAKLPPEPHPWLVPVISCIRELKQCLGMRPTDDFADRLRGIVEQLEALRDALRKGTSRNGSV